MVFGGLQKLTLLDYPGKTACTVFTLGCNYRCPFCHNASLVLPSTNLPVIDMDEILLFLKKRVGLLDAVCISGGEPLIHEKLGDFIEAVKTMGFFVKLDTNGSFPERLKTLVQSGMVDYVAMDIKNIPEKYDVTIGLSECDLVSIEESIDFLLAGTISYEFRTTVIREFHTADDLVAVARRIAKAKQYYLQQFVDSKDLLQKGLSCYSNDELQLLIGKINEVLPSAELR